MLHTGEKEFDLKYYSAEREVDFCGHATIAIMYDLIASGEELRKHDTLTIGTNRGRLTVENRIRSENAVFIMAPKPEEKELLCSAGDIAAGLGIERDHLDGGSPVSVINAGAHDSPGTHEKPGYGPGHGTGPGEAENFCLKSKVDIIEVFTPETAAGSNDYRVRVFAPTFGYLEDPATGSGNSAFGYYLMRQGRFGAKTVTIEQNGHRERFNIVNCRNGVMKRERSGCSWGRGYNTAGGGIPPHLRNHHRACYIDSRERFLMQQPTK